MELILGHAGENHIDAQEMRNLFAGVVGEGSYILRGMEASVVNANTVRISEGGGIAQGAYFETAMGGETVPIDNGTQGMKRYDLICPEYSNDGTESMGFTVIKGTPSANPQDPSYKTGRISGGANVQFPFYRVRLNGISIDGVDVIADKPNSEGTDGIWTYEKRANGTYSAWAFADLRTTDGQGTLYGVSPLFWKRYNGITLPSFNADNEYSLNITPGGFGRMFFVVGVDRDTDPLYAFPLLGYIGPTPNTLLKANLEINGRWQ